MSSHSGTILMDLSSSVIQLFEGDGFEILEHDAAKIGAVSLRSRWVRRLLLKPVATER